MIGNSSIISKLYILTLGFTLFSCASETHIAKKKIKVAETFKDFEISCKKGQDLSTYYTHEKTYYYKESFDEVWKVYTETEPKVIWDGPISFFRTAYSKRDNEGYIKKEQYTPPPQKGIVYQLRLKVIPLVNLNVQFEITNLSKEDGILEFTYGADNKSQGKQIVQFTETSTGTKLVHKSYFKSGNTYRDEKLYPKFHVKFMDAYHAKMLEQIQLSQKKIQ